MDARTYRSASTATDTQLSSATVHCAFQDPLSRRLKLHHQSRVRRGEARLGTDGCWWRTHVSEGLLQPQERCHSSAISCSFASVQYVTDIFVEQGINQRGRAGTEASTSAWAELLRDVWREIDAALGQGAHNS